VAKNKQSLDKIKREVTNLYYMFIYFDIDPITPNLCNIYNPTVQLVGWCLTALSAQKGYIMP